MSVKMKIEGEVVEDMCENGDDLVRKMLFLAQISIIKLMYGVKLEIRKRTSELMSEIEVVGHVMRKKMTVRIRSVSDVDITGELGRQLVGWRQQTEKDMLRAEL